MNKFIKRILIYTLISINTLTLKASNKEESTKDIIYDYYDDNYVINSKIINILNKIDEYYDITSIDIDEKDNIESILLLNALIENDNLTSEEKELGYELLPFFLDYNDIDKYSIYERLNTLDIIYEDKKLEIDTNELVAATYLPSENTITCYIEDGGVLHHELFHVLIPMEDFPKTLKEGLVSELSLEYFTDEEVSLVSTYKKYVAFTKALTFLIDSDTLIELASYNDLISFKEILLNEGTITEDELDNILNLLDGNPDITTRGEITTTLINSFTSLKENSDALSNLRQYTIYNHIIDNNYYFNKEKIKTVSVE